MRNAPIQITAHGEGWHDIPYIRHDVHQAELAERDKKIAELEAAQQLISVDERLPENQQCVLIRTDWIEPFQTASWAKDAWGFWRWIGAIGTVTHWKPLPPPPTP